MEKFQVDPNNDIAEERYKGPGPVVASAGYVALSHMATTIAGFLVLGAIGSLAAKPTMAIKETFSKFSRTNIGHSNWLIKGPAHVAGWIPKGADAVAHKVLGIGKTISRGKVASSGMSEDKLAAFMFAGGVGGASGWIGSTIWGVVKGGHEGNVGKHQFERAKAEIKDLRERNDDLEKINDELHANYVKASTQKDGQAQEQPAPSDALTKDEAAIEKQLTAVAEEAPKPHHHSDAEKPSHRIQHHAHAAIEHHGKIHAHQQHEQAAHAHA